MVGEMQSAGITFVLLAIVALAAFMLLRNHRATENSPRQSLAGVDAMTGTEFEKFCAELLRAQGWRVQVIGRSGDFGVDLLAHKAGRSCGVQTKRYRGRVGRSAVSDVYAGARLHGADETLVITSGHYTAAARTLAATTGTRLVDREGITAWLNRNAKFLALAPIMPACMTRPGIFSTRSSLVPVLPAWLRHTR